MNLTSGQRFALLMMRHGSALLGDQTKGHPDPDLRMVNRDVVPVLVEKGLATCDDKRVYITLEGRDVEATHHSI